MDTDTLSEQDIEVENLLVRTWELDDEDDVAASRHTDFDFDAQLLVSSAAYKAC